MTAVANCHRYQLHRQQICHRYQRYRRPILPPVPLVLLTLVANLPLVSTTPVANNGNNIRLQTPLSKFEGKKINIYVNSTTQRCPNKIIKIFQLEDFFHLSPVSLTPVVYLEPRIFPRNFEKIRNGRSGILRCLGKLIHEKNQKSKISWHCPFHRPPPIPI